MAIDPMDLKRTLMSTALRLMQDPRVQKVAQNPKVLQGIVSAWEFKTRVEREFDAGVRRVAHDLDLATPEEVRGMRSTIERLERELEGERERVTPTNPPAADERPKGRSPRRRARKASGPGSAPPPP